MLPSLKINMSPKKAPFQKDISSCNYWFSRDYLTFRVCSTPVIILEPSESVRRKVSPLVEVLMPWRCWFQLWKGTRYCYSLVYLGVRGRLCLGNWSWLFRMTYSHAHGKVGGFKFLPVLLVNFLRKKTVGAMPHVGMHSKERVWLQNLALKWSYQ